MADRQEQSIEEEQRLVHHHEEQRLEEEQRLALDVEQTQSLEDDQVVAKPNTNFKLSCFSQIFALYCCNIKIHFQQDCRGGVFDMVESFLRETNGTLPFKGQCFLLSDFLQWAKTLRALRCYTLSSICLKRRTLKNRLFFSSRMHPSMPSPTLQTCF